jgi:hypothetical protein
MDDADEKAEENVAVGDGGRSLFVMLADIRKSLSLRNL